MAQLSPRSVRWCVHSRVPVQLPCASPHGCSHALCWVQGSPGKVSWNTHVEARWWVGFWEHLRPSLILQVSSHSWESSGLASVGCRGRGVCAGSALHPPACCFRARGLPGWHRVPLLLMDREKTPEQESPNCCPNWSHGKMAQAQYHDVSRTQPVSTGREESIGAGVSPSLPPASCPPLPTACLTWVVSITATLLTSRAPFLPMASSPKTKRPSTRQCCGAVVLS